METPDFSYRDALPNGPAHRRGAGINPGNLVTRLYDPSMTVTDLQVAMVMTIRTEFEHNLSQQIYVSQNVWETVKGVKEQEINMADRKRVV